MNWFQYFLVATGGVLLSIIAMTPRVSAESVDSVQLRVSHILDGQNTTVPLDCNSETTICTGVGMFVFRGSEQPIKIFVERSKRDLFVYLSGDQEYFGGKFRDHLRMRLSDAAVQVKEFSVFSLPSPPRRRSPNSRAAMAPVFEFGEQIRGILRVRWAADLDLPEK